MEPGRRLGPYEILSELGAGGMGEVYRARDSRLGREVAVKVLPGAAETSPEALERLRREAQSLAALSHPNLVSVFDVGRAEGVDYVVMELLEGSTLRERLAKEGPLPAATAVRIGAGIARGLAVAHRQGFVHRDLKPANVFLTEDDRVKVLDFGLAREMPLASDEPEETREMLTQTGTLLGTPGYMAPEQVRGEVATPPSDVFALGCILHEMLTATAPFARPSLGETLSAILRDPPSRSTRLEEAPSALRRLVASCLEKDPSRRPAAGPAAADQLHRRGRDTRAGAGRRSLRRWVPALAGLGLLALLAAGAWLLFPRLSTPPETRSPTELRSIAVLPVVDRTENHETLPSYLVEGVTESWILGLSRLEDLKVISRASVFRLPAEAIDPVDTGERLGVQALLLGTIRPETGGLVLSAELVDTRDGAHLWGSLARGDPGSLLRLQEQLLAELRNALRGEPADPSGITPSATAPETGDPEAYRLYLQGRQQWRTREPEMLRAAIETFNQALVRDPTYARAYAGLADVYNLIHLYGAVPSSEAFPRARAAARRALELQPDLPEAPVSLAYVAHYWEWDWDAAEAGYRRALTLNPNDANAWQFYGELLTSLGRFDEGDEAGLRAIELDPLAPMPHAIHGWNREMARRYEEARGQARRTLDLFPDFPPARYYLARAEIRMGDIERGLDIITALQNPDVASLSRPWLAWALASAGRAEEARALTEELHRMVEAGQRVSPYYLAYPHIALGDEDAAFELLERGLREKVEQMVWLKVDPTLDPLRDDPRHDDLLQRVGLPAE